MTEKATRKSSPLDHEAPQGHKLGADHGAERIETGSTLGILEVTVQDLGLERGERLAEEVDEHAAHRGREVLHRRVERDVDDRPDRVAGV